MHACSVDLVLLFFFFHFVLLLLLLLLHSVETPESPVSSSVDLGVLSLLAFFVVVVVVVVKTMMGSSVASVFSSSLLLLALLSVVQAEVLFDSNLTIGRNTLSGMRFDLRWW